MLLTNEVIVATYIHITHAGHKPFAGAIKLIINAKANMGQKYVL